MPQYLAITINFILLRMVFELSEEMDSKRECSEPPHVPISAIVKWAAEVSRSERDLFYRGVGAEEEILGELIPETLKSLEEFGYLKITSDDTVQIKMHGAYTIKIFRLSSELKRSEAKRTD